MPAEGYVVRVSGSDGASAVGLAMRCVAIDPGARRVGLAVGDSDGFLASPRPAIEVRDPTRLLGSLVAAIRAEEAELVVVGHPLDTLGREGASAHAAQRLAEQLRTALGEGIRVELWDERFTTRAASRAMQASGRSAKQQRAHIDSAAATLLLESFLARSAR